MEKELFVRITDPEKIAAIRRWHGFNDRLNNGGTLSDIEYREMVNIEYDVIHHVMFLTWGIHRPNSFD
jgi:hypothetical protein